MCDFIDKDCKCYKAVMSVYLKMSAAVPTHIAIDAAQHVYRHHHPEQSKFNAFLTVERWVNDNHMH